MSDKLNEATRLAQIHYESGSTSAVYIATSFVAAEDGPEEPFKLIEVNEHTIPSGIVPLRFGQRLFEAANQPKQFILLPGHDHNYLLPAAYYDELAAFLSGPNH